MVFAIQQLILNLRIADKTTCLHPSEDSPEDPPIGGPQNNKVPSNMTALSNYVKGLNPRAFQSATKHHLASADPTLPLSSRNTTTSLAYGVLTLSCDKDPELLINQVSYEWARFGNNIKIKELQAVETKTPYQIYYVYALTHRQTLIDEQRDIFKSAQTRMHHEDYFLDHDLPIEWGYRPLPLCSLRINVPRIPKHSEPTNMAKLPSNIQTCRKVLHLEVDKHDLEFVEHLVKYAKTNGIYHQ